MTLQTFTPIEYLKLDIASNYGLDKETWDARLDWFKTIEPLIDPERVEDLNTNGIFQALAKEAEEPALFYAGCLAYRAAKKNKSVTYPISLDATASGAQLLSVLIGCAKSASMCNVIDTGDREDLYTNIHDSMNLRLEGQCSIDRKDAKQAVMTSLYGSKKEPRAVFGEGERLDVFYQTMVEEVPGIWELNEALLNLADPTVDEYNWVLPDNFHVKIKVKTKIDTPVEFLGETFITSKKVQGPVENDLSLGANSVHSVDGMVVREMSRRCNFDPDAMINLLKLIKQQGGVRHSLMQRDQDQEVITLWEHYLQSGFLSARILEVLDDQNLWWVDKGVICNLISTLPEKPFSVLSVHDCFRVHPNYGNDLRKQYNQILSEIASSNLLQYIVSQISKQQLYVSKFGDLSADVKEANYALS